jgi:hypothetical protein
MEITNFPDFRLKMAADVHHQKVAEICHLLVSGDLVDLVLVCRDGVVPAHAAMLAATGGISGKSLEHF